MKRIILPLILCAIFATYLYADLNPFAYGLSSSLSLDDATLTVNYSLNADATGVKIVILSGEDVVKEVTCAGITKGSYTENISTIDLPKQTALTWKVEVSGNSVANPTEHTTNYSFYHPSAVDIDNNPENPTFGLILTNEAMQSVVSKTSGYLSAQFGAGIFAFNAAFEPITNGSKPGYNGGITFTTTRADGTGTAYAPRRIRISKDGRIFVTSLNTDGKYLWEVNPENLDEWTPIFQYKTLNANKEILDANSNFISAPNVGFDVRGEGEDLKLLMLSTNLRGFPQIYAVAAFKCHEYNLGTATTWSTEPSKTILNGKYMINYTGDQVAYDAEGGVWFCQHQSTAKDAFPSLIHFDKNGVEDYKEIVNNRMSGGIRFNADFSKVIIAGIDAGTAKSQKATIYSVSKDANGKPILTKDQEINMATLGANLNDFAFDYAGNLYAVSNSGEKIVAYAMPYSGTVSTPAASKYAFEVEATLNIYASGLKFHGINPSNGKATISYFLNAPATAVEFQLIDNSQDIVKTIALSDPGHLTAGEHNNIEIDLFGTPVGDYTWAIKATANNHAQALTHINKNARYKDKYYSARGLTVDNSTESPYLGRIYIAESYEGKTTSQFSYNRTTHQGIYILDPTLNDIRNGIGTANDPAYGGSVTWSDGDGKGPYRMTLDKEGYLYICDNGSSTTGVWRMDPAHPENNFTQVLSTSGRGTNYNFINSLAIHEEGNKKTLYIIDNNAKLAANSQSYLKQYDITNQPNSTLGKILIDLCDTVVNSHNCLVHGVHNDFWIFQYRSNTRDKYPAILHYRNEEGTLIKDIDASSNGNQWWMVPKDASNTRGCGAVSKDGSLLAFYGGERIIIYSIGYDSKGTPTTVDKIQDLTTGYTNVDAMAFDIANNLYLVSSTKERFYAYAYVKPGTSNTFTTPAPSAQSITIEETVPHIMAYDLNVIQDGRYYEFSFYANSNAIEGKILFYEGANLKGELTIPQVTKGANTFRVLTHEIPEGTNMTWKLQLTGAPNRSFGPIFTQNTALNRAFAAIDNSPESNYFGRIYIANRIGSGKGECFVYNYDYSSVASNELFGMSKLQSAGRPAVDAEGYVYWADYGDNHGGIWVMNPNTLTTEAFFQGEQDSDGVWTNGSVDMGSSCSGAFIYGHGADSKLFMVNEDGTSTLPKNGYTIYQIGQPNGTINRTWDKAPSQTVSIADNTNGNFSIVGTSHGTWLCQNRSNGLNQAGAYSLMFYDNNGTRKYVSNNNALIITGSNGGGMAVSADESQLAMVNGTGDILLFNIEWNGDIPTLNLYTTYRTTYSFIGSIHFDYAGNLVATAGDSFEGLRLVVFSTPTNNNTTIIPARTKLTVSEKIVLLDTEDNYEIISTYTGIEKRISVDRSLTAGMFNTLCLPFAVSDFTGTPLENATVWQYTGAVVKGEGNNKEIFLDFQEVTSTEAGVPYLVEPSNDITAPMDFPQATITVAEGSNVDNNNIMFCGILEPEELQAGNKSILFLVSNNNLAWANVTANMNGMRAYFKVNEPSLLSARTRAYIRREPTVATDMENITTSETEIKKVIYNGTLYIIRGDEVYTIQGTKVK